MGTVYLSLRYLQRLANPRATQVAPMLCWLGHKDTSLHMFSTDSTFPAKYCWSSCLSGEVEHADVENWLCTEFRVLLHTVQTILYLFTCMCGVYMGCGQEAFENCSFRSPQVQGLQTWWQMLLPTEPPQQPSFTFLFVTKLHQVPGIQCICVSRNERGE